MSILDLLDAQLTYSAPATLLQGDAVNTVATGTGSSNVIPFRFKLLNDVNGLSPRLVGEERSAISKNGVITSYSVTGQLLVDVLAADGTLTTKTVKNFLYSISDDDSFLGEDLTNAQGTVLLSLPYSVVLRMHPLHVVGTPGGDLVPTLPSAMEAGDVVDKVLDAKHTIRGRLPYPVESTLVGSFKK